jgi:hypothetical protein
MMSRNAMRRDLGGGRHAVNRPRGQQVGRRGVAAPAVQAELIGSAPAVVAPVVMMPVVMVPAMVMMAVVPAVMMVAVMPVTVMMAPVAMMPAAVPHDIDGRKLVGRRRDAGAEPNRGGRGELRRREQQRNAGQDHQNEPAHEVSLDVPFPRTRRRRCRD